MLYVKKSYLMILFIILPLITPLTVIDTSAQVSLQAVDRYPQTFVKSNEPVYYFVQATGVSDLTLEADMNITLDVGLVVDTSVIVPHGTCNLNVYVVFPNETPAVNAFVRIRKIGVGIVGAGYTDRWGYITFYIWGGAYFIQAYYDVNNDGIFDYYGNLSIPFFNKGAVVKVTLYPVEESLGIHGASYRVQLSQKMFKIGANWYVGVVPGIPALYTEVKAANPTMPGDLRVKIESKVAVNIETGSGETIYTTTYNVQPFNYTDNLKPLVFLLDQQYNIIDSVELIDAPTNKTIKVLAFDDWGLENVRIHAYNSTINTSLQLTKDQTVSNLEIALRNINNIINSIESSLGNYTLTIPRPSMPLKVYQATITIAKPGETVYVRAQAVDEGGRKSNSQTAVFIGVNNTSSIVVVDPTFKFNNYIINKNSYTSMGNLFAYMGLPGLSEYYNGLAALGTKYSEYENLLFNYTALVEKYKPYIVDSLPGTTLLDTIRPKAIILAGPLLGVDTDQVNDLIEYSARHNITLVLTPQAIIDPTITGGDRTVFFNLLEAAGLVDYYVAAKILSQAYPNTMLSIPWINWTGPIILANKDIVYAVNSTIQGGWQLGYAGMDDVLRELLSLNISLEHYKLLAKDLGVDQDTLLEQVEDSLGSMLGAYMSLANATYRDGKLLVNGVEVSITSQLVGELAKKPRAIIIARSTDNLVLATRYDMGGLHVIYTGISPQDLGLIVDLLDQKPRTYITKTPLQGILVPQETLEEYQDVAAGLVNFSKLLLNDTVIVPYNGYAIYNMSNLRKGELAVTIFSAEGSPQVDVNTDGMVMKEHNGVVYNIVIANASSIVLNISVDNANSMLVPVKIIVRAKPLKPKPVIYKANGLTLQLEYNKTAYKLLGSPEEIVAKLKKEDIVGISKLVVPLNTLPARKIVLDIQSLIENGRISRDLNITLVDSVGNITLVIREGTSIEAGTLEFKPIKSPPSPPEDSYIIAPVVDIGPSGTVFDKPAVIEFTVNNDTLQMLLADKNNTELNLSIAYYDYDNNTWVNIPTIYVNNIAKANITHFTPFTLIATLVQVNQTTNNTTLPPTNTTLPPINNTTTTTTNTTTTTTATNNTQTTTTTTQTTQTTTTTTSPTTTTAPSNTTTSPTTTQTTTPHTTTTTRETTSTTTTTSSKTATVTPITSTSTNTETTSTPTTGNSITLPFIGVRLGRNEALILGVLVLLGIIMLLLAAAKRR